MHLEQQQHTNTDNTDNISNNTVKKVKENFEIALSTAQEEEAEEEEVTEDPSYMDENINETYDEDINEEKPQVFVQQQPSKPFIIKKISPSNKYNIYEFNLLSLDEKKSLLVAKEDKLVKTSSHLNLSLNNNLLTLPEIQHLSKQYQRVTMDKVERIKKSMDSTVSHVAATQANIVMMPSSSSMTTTKSPSSSYDINNKKSKYFLTKRLADIVQKKNNPNVLRNDNYRSEHTEDKEQQDFVAQEELFMSMSKQKLMPTAIKSYPTSKVSNVNEKFYLDIFIPS